MASEDAGTLLTFARDDLIQRVSEAKTRIWLCSPFLTRGVASRLARAAAAAPAGDARLLTALVPGSVRVGALDPEALRVMREAEFKIASVANLHAKASLVDSSWGLVGSGNLTDAGLGSENRSNVELGVVLSGEQIGVASRLFEEWWEKAKPVDEAAIESYAALPRIKRRKGEIGDFGPTLDVPGGDRDTELRRILAEDRATADSRGYWIKSNYHRADDSRWWRRDWISDWRKASYRVDDLIVLYLSAKDGGPACCPAIVRVVEPSHFNRAWVERYDARAAKRWPFVTKTEVVTEIPIPDGIALDLVNKSGRSVQGGYCSITRGQFESFAREMDSILSP